MRSQRFRFKSFTWKDESFNCGCHFRKIGLMFFGGFSCFNMAASLVGQAKTGASEISQGAGNTPRSPMRILHSQQRLF